MAVDNSNKRNIKLILEFDGTDFCGFQIQPDVRTVHGVLDEAILKALKDDDIKLTGCSRTDAGVHAEQYCANFNTSAEYPAEKLKPIINSYLPKDVVILESAEVPDTFNARHDVIRKTYRYTICSSPDFHPLRRGYSYFIPQPIDLDLMKDASDILLGEHDFSAFCGKLEEGKSPIRTIERIDISRSEDMIAIEVTSRSFLYRMVRIIAGTLADAGRGLISAEDVRNILESRDKNQMRAAAPAHGLTLVMVEY